MTASRPESKGRAPVTVRSGIRPAPVGVGKPPAPAHEAAQDEMLYLAGRPSLGGFVRYVRNHAHGPPDKGALVDQWRSARGYVAALERSEPGAADRPTMGRLGPRYQPLLEEFFKNPLVRHTFNTVPTDIVLVPLDRLVVYQKHIDLTFVRQLRERLGDPRDEEAVFRACLLNDHPRPPVTWSGVARDRFVFLSPSNDLRYLGATPLTPDQLSGWGPRGAVVGVVGIAVGFGTNFLNALYVGDRLILNNGSHRAYALRESGVTRVPCVVQHIPDRDALEAVAPKHVLRRPELYLDHPRPPMLRDYFDPRLRTTFRAHRRVRQVTVRFQVEESFVPALDLGHLRRP